MMMVNAPKKKQVLFQDIKIITLAWRLIFDYGQFRINWMLQSPRISRKWWIIHQFQYRKVQICHHNCNTFWIKSSIKQHQSRLETCKHNGDLWAQMVKKKNSSFIVSSSIWSHRLETQQKDSSITDSFGNKHSQPN